ncbi:MAG TPA: hypothetical protein VGN23_00105 [Verrucomicrobiae bacterium]|jgi:hypothetical protein
MTAIAKKLVRNVVAPTGRKMTHGKLSGKSSPKSADPFLSDKTAFRGQTPADLAAYHDRYLYGDQ